MVVEAIAFTNMGVHYGFCRYFNVIKLFDITHVQIMSHQATTTDLNMLNVLNALSSLSLAETKGVAILLGVPLNVVSDIDSLHNGAVTRKAQYIQAWLNTDPNRSWERIIDCLHRNGFAAIASNITSQYLLRDLEPAAFDTHVSENL